VRAIIINGPISGLFAPVKLNQLAIPEVVHPQARKWDVKAKELAFSTKYRHFTRTVMLFYEFAYVLSI